MTKDTRDANIYFNDSDIFSYLMEYSEKVKAGLRQVAVADLGRAADFLRDSRMIGRVFVAGNGGSASISDHLCCDWQKGTDIPHQKRGLSVTSLTGSVAMFSAIANDIGYSQTFSYQLERLDLSSKDVVVLISSSGNSPNVVNAAITARTRKARVIALTGFDGGLLRPLGDASLHVPVNNYGIVEDCHQSLMHILAQFHYLKSK